VSPHITDPPNLKSAVPDPHFVEYKITVQLPLQESEELALLN
jgi:hypothetical protein